MPLVVPGAAFSPGTSNCSLLKAAAETTIFDEVAPARPLAAKSIVMLLATLCDRLVKLTRPFTALRLVVPCNTPLPAFRLAVTSVELSLPRKLPN